MNPPTDKSDPRHEARVKELADRAAHHPIPFNEALRRMLSTPPKPRKDGKEGAPKKARQRKPKSASDD